MMGEFSLRTLRAASVCAAALALALTCCSGKRDETKDASRQSENQENVVIERTRTPGNVELEALDGSTVQLSTYQGKLVIISFLATWNKDCIREVAALNELNHKCQRAAIAIIGVFTDENPSRVLPPFVKKYDIGFPVYVNGKEAAGRLGGMPRFPTTYFLIREGSIYERAAGYRSMRELEIKLQEMMKQRL